MVPVEKMRPVARTGEENAGSHSSWFFLTTNDKEVGWITSATESQRLGQRIALGYVKRGANDIGTGLNVVEPANIGNLVVSRVAIVDLPFVEDGCRG